MAMTPRDADPTPAGHARLQTALDHLRGRTDERWVEIADSMLATILATSRPPHPVRGRIGDTTFHVSEQLLTTHILDVTDSISGAAVDAVRVRTDDDRCTGLVIVITARYGVSLIPLADRIRVAVRERLKVLLGELVPPISVLNVHVDDVTRGDPWRA